VSLIKITARFHHITANKREIKDFPKLPLATSFINIPLFLLRQNFFYVGYIIKHLAKSVKQKEF